MAKVEIDESQFLAGKKVVQTVEQMLRNPEARKLVQQAQKLVQPGVAIPEIDAAAAANEVASAAAKRMDDFIASQTKEKEEERTRNALASLTTKFEAGRHKLRERGYQQEGIDKVEALMQVKGIVDHEDAVTIFERDNPPPAPVTPSGLPNFFSAREGGEDTMKKLIESRGEDDAVLSQMTTQALADIRGPFAGQRR